MQTVDAAQARLLELCRPLPTETLPLRAALGRNLAHDVKALRTHPPFDASAMDGYAVRAAEVETLPATLHVIGESAAGRRFAGSVEAGEAVRIFTGAPVPAGTDCVIVQEDVTRDGNAIRITGKPAKPAAHIRRAGLDCATGATIARSGDRLTAARLGLIAAAGHTGIAVHGAPRVELLACGDELKLPGEPLGLDDIVATNGLMLDALLSRSGASVSGADRIVGDDMDALCDAINASDAEILVTIGGASVGDHDLVQSALKRCGTDIAFWKIAMRPGKPLMVGTRGKQLVIGLPGNPVSAQVCALLFVLPAIRYMLGNRDPLPQEQHGLAAVELPPVGERADYQRAQALLADGKWQIAPQPVQDSSMLSVLASANALLIRPAGSPAAAAGSPVRFLQLEA